MLDLAHLPPRERVRHTIRTSITAGRLRIGDRLPGEEQLGRETGISRMTVRAALTELETAGVLSRSGRRWVVAGNGETRQQGTVVLCTTMRADSNQLAVYAQSGWEYAIVLGAIAGLQQHGRMPLIADPANPGLAAVTPSAAILLREVAQHADVARTLTGLRRAGATLVAYGASPVWPDALVVDADQEAGGRLLIERLVARGRRRILRFWQHDAPDGVLPAWLRWREQGILAALATHRLPVLPVVHGAEPQRPTSPARAELAVRTALGYLLPHLTGEDRVDAILTPSDDFTFAVARAVREAGLRPHIDVDIAGYDDYWQSSNIRNFLPTERPTLTVDKRNHAIGLRLADLAAGKVPRDGKTQLVLPEVVETPVET